MNHSFSIYLKIWCIRNPFFISVAKLLATLFFIVIAYFFLNYLFAIKYFHIVGQTENPSLEKALILLESANDDERREGERLLLNLAEGDSIQAKLRLARLYLSEPLIAKKWLVQIGNNEEARKLIAEIDRNISANNFSASAVENLAHDCDRELALRSKDLINNAEEVALVLMRLFCPTIFPEKTDVTKELEGLAKNGNDIALLYLGKLYLDGNEAQYEPAKGKAYLELACRRGIEKACGLVEENFPEADGESGDKNRILKELKLIEKQLRNLAE